MELAPVVLFVYNRPKHALQTLQALANNDLADESTLYIFADGPKENASKPELDKIKEVRIIIKSTQWCEHVTIVERDKNKGLDNSIVDGITEIISKHGNIIVLEDDIVTAPGFLRFMNDNLLIYESSEEVKLCMLLVTAFQSNGLNKKLFY